MIGMLSSQTECRIEGLEPTQLYIRILGSILIDRIRFPDNNDPSNEAGMGKLHQIGKVIIRVYPNDHLPPHFHVIAPDDEALIEIDSLAVLAGSIGKAHRRAVMAWATDNRRIIVAEWNRINPRFAIA